MRFELYVTVSTAAFAIAAQSVGAQAPAAAPAAAEEVSPQGLEEIIVTARRTEENLQSTPVAVTALGNEALRTSQVSDPSALQRIAPSLVIATGNPGSSGTTQISIRGAGQLQPGTNTDPSVGTYIDGVYVPRPSTGQVDLVDIKRAEVLRGPQGTLFGRNTPAGALNITTNQPTGDFEASLKGEYGNYDYRSVGVILNAPINGDVLAARVVYNFNEHDGYARNVSLNRDHNDRNSHYIRGKLLFSPEDSEWDITLAGDYNRIKDKGQFSALSAYDTGIFGPALAPFLHTKAQWYDTYSTPLLYGDPQDYLKAYGFSGTVNGRIGEVDVKSITAYRYSFARGVNDLDGTPLGILDSDNGYGSKQYSQELQALGEIGDRFNYIVGAYYSRETGHEVSLSTAFAFLGPLGPPTLRNDGNVKNITTGVFSQAYFKLNDAVRLSGGLRWTWDKRQVVLHNLTVYNLPGDADIDPVTPGLQANCNIPNPDGGVVSPCNQTQKAKFNYPAWTVGVDYRANDNLFLYAKTSGAAQSGGFNLRVGSVPAFKPTKTKDVEVGAKTNWLDNRLRFNVALFYNWQTDIQRNVSAVVRPGDPATPVSLYVVNAGDARVYGAEFEVSAAPWTGMTINSNLSLLRGHYVDGTFTETQIVANTTAAPGCTVNASGTSSTCIVDRSGETLTQLPRYQVNIGATQKLPLSFGELSLHLDYAYVSSQTFGPLTPAATQPDAVKANYALAAQVNRIKGYGLVNGRVGIELNDSQVEIYGFGRNILGKKYVTRGFGDLLAAGLGIGTEYIGDPATYGIGATVRFGKP